MRDDDGQEARYQYRPSVLGRLRIHTTSAPRNFCGEAMSSSIRHSVSQSLPIPKGVAFPE
jgi:hypothetical protein